MDIINLYKSILGYAGLCTDENGSVFMSDGKTAVMVGGKVLLLPTDKNLKNLRNDEEVIFHPLTESLTRGESDVLSTYRQALNIRMNYLFGILCVKLLTYASNSDISSKFNPDQTEALVLLKDADKTSFDNFMTIMRKGIRTNYERLFVHVYLNKGGSLGGKRYSRSGIITFPFYEEVIKADKEIYGVKIRQKDKEVFRILCEFIIPNIEEPNAYSYGSDADIAPFMDALLFSTIKVMNRFTNIIDQYEDFIEDVEDLRGSSDWVDVMLGDPDVLRRAIRSVPPQDGNRGSINKREDKEGFVPMAEAINGPAREKEVVRPALQQRPDPGFQQTQNRQPVQAAGWNQGAGQPYQDPNASKLVFHDGKLDFNSILQQNPALQGLPTPFSSWQQQPSVAPGWNQGGGQMVYQNAAPQRVPSWAMTGSGNMNVQQNYPPNTGMGGGFGRTNRGF